MSDLTKTECPRCHGHKRADQTHCLQCSLIIENERLKRMAYVIAARLVQSELVIDDETLAARNECLNYHGATSNE